MANINNFPMNYPFYTPNYPQNDYRNNNLIWVQGEAGAKSYLIAPNNTVPLWDSEAQVIYLKSADASGMPSMKILDYTIRNEANNALKTPLSDDAKEYATMKDLEALKGEILAKIDKLESESIGV